MTSIELPDDLPDQLESLVRCEQLLRLGSVVRQLCSIVPGLLQTPGYAAEAHQAAAFPLSGAALEARVQLRMARQQAWLGEGTFEFLLDESAIRRVIGGPDQMVEQLACLLAIGGRPNVSIRVLPYSIGAYAGVLQEFQMLDVSPDNVYIYHDGFGNGSFELNPPELCEYYTVFERAAAAALSPADSVALIREAMSALATSLRALPNHYYPFTASIPSAACGGRDDFARAFQLTYDQKCY
jgi:hypothetical protein